ncbi:hypothetical protein CMO94_01895 [Candidatus Woesearchaeota archaeon]|nr:hypothetical protein [Candidatus Woesearchaeota archaeon]
MILIVAIIAIFSISILLWLIFFNPFSEKITPISEEGLSEVGTSQLNVKDEDLPSDEIKAEKERQSCTSSSWSCGNFEDCSVSGQQTRTCTLVDTSCINPDAVKPVTIQSCTPPIQKSTIIEEKTQDEEELDLLKDSKNVCNKGLGKWETKSGQCNVNVKPFYCDEDTGNLVVKCSICGCIEGQECRDDENCYDPRVCGNQLCSQYEDCINDKCVLTKPPYPDPEPLRDYFEDDEFAQAILEGQETYNIRDFKLLCQPGSTATTDEFGFKIVNGFKQIGYFFHNVCDLPRDVHDDDNVGVILVNAFQRDNTLPESDIIDKAVLEKLDSLLKNVRATRDTLSKDFICYDFIAPAPLNDASKNHRAFLLMNAINAFPERLRPREIDCGNSQIDFVIQCDNLGTGSKYWEAQDEKCENQNNKELSYLPSDDFSLYKTTIHEYAHMIDCTATPEIDYCVDTTDFISISYDLDDYFEPGWIFYKPKLDINNEEEHKQHFFSYADGWSPDPKDYPSYRDYRTSYEDFAVTVEMYVTNGIVYRDYMQDKPILKQKYNWVKENVFNGREFNTGDSNYASYAPDLSDYGIPGGIIAAGGITELQASNFWDYNFR